MLNKNNNIYTVDELRARGIFANSGITEKDFEQAAKILEYVHEMTEKSIEKGSGPFFAVITDKEGHIVAQEANSVVKSACSIAHAEVNTIYQAEKILGTYDLSGFDLSIYVNAEPCLMCLGAIMWSGIKSVYYSLPSEQVEKITGFDEGFKPNWPDEFKTRGIRVYGNINPEKGVEIMTNYVNSGKKVYKPEK